MDCSECGQLILDNTPLVQLRIHCIRMARSQKIFCDGMHRRDNDRLNEEYIERRQKIVNKWQSWVDALDKVIEKPEHAGH